MGNALLSLSDDFTLRDKSFVRRLRADAAIRSRLHADERFGVPMNGRIKPAVKTCVRMRAKLLEFFFIFFIFKIFDIESVAILEYLSLRPRDVINKIYEKKKTTLNGGSLGSWIDEERS